MVLVTKDNRIPIYYKLRNNGDKWNAYDIEIEGVSLVSHYRNKYGVIIKNKGIDGLLAHVKNSIDLGETIIVKSVN